MARQEAPERRQRLIRVERDSVAQNRQWRGSSRSTAAHARRQAVDIVERLWNQPGGSARSRLISSPYQIRMKRLLLPEEVYPGHCRPAAG
jgi:hypothetical protein